MALWSSRSLRGAAGLWVWFALAGPAAAQDGAGGDELDAILNLAPSPSSAPAAASGEGTAGQEPAPKKRRGKSGKAAKRADKDRPKKPRRQSGVSAEYQALKESWHAPPVSASASSASAEAAPALVFHVVGEPTPFVVMASSQQGGFGPDQRDVARAAFRGAEGGPEVNEHLLNLIYAASRHFNVPYVHLVSGIRRDRGGSRHTHGLAADVVLPGVSDEELAAWFRSQGFVGVGVYTRAGFVHVDVREQSFFWIDPSPPGKKLKIRPERAQEAKDADAAALARGEQPVVIPIKLSKALERRSVIRRKQHAKHKKVVATKRAPG